MPNKYRFLSVANQQMFGYHAFAELMQEKLGGQSLPITTADKSISTMIIDSANLSTMITNCVQSGNNLILTLAGSNQGPLYRLNFVVLNHTGLKQGVVIDRTANTITIRPRAGETLSAVTDFLVNTSVTEGFQLVQNNGSGSQQGREVMPRLVSDFLQTFRANRPFYRTDFAGTWIDMALRGDMAGAEAALVKLQVNDLSVDMMSQKEIAAVFGKLGTETVNNQIATTQMGFIQAVDTRGGVPNQTSVPITFDKHKQIIQDIYDNYNTEEQEIICLCGSNYEARIMNGGQQYKYEAGTASVLEGSGLSFRSVVTNFGRQTFVPFGLFRNKDVFVGASSTGYRNLQESALYISVTAMKDYNKQIVPVIQEYHGAYGNNGPGIYRTQTAGIIDENGKIQASSANQLDQVDIGQLSDSSQVVANAAPCGYFMFT
jgi:hypothetical protein